MTGEELAAAVEELDSRLERLRVLMEMYFQGIEKIPPNIVQKDVDRRIWVLRREKIRNTGTRFRFQQIVQRYNTFGSYWQRILREIENGTYKRDVLRAKKRFGPDAKPAAPTRPASVELNEDDLTDDDLADFGDLGPLPTGKPPAVAPNRPPGPPPNKPAAPPPPAAAPPAVAAKPAAPPAPTRSLPPKPPPSPAVPSILAKKVENDDDLDDMLDAALGPAAHGGKKPEPPVVAPPKPAPPVPVERPRPQPVAAKPASPQGDDYRRVYAQYVEARRRNGESTAGITYETLAKSLDQTKDKLRERTAGKKVEFEVAVKDGKTILKPVVR